MRKARRAPDPALTAEALRALLAPRERRRTPAGLADAPALGPGGALWAPTGRATGTRRAPAWLIVSQGRPLASLLCSLAARQGVPLLGALCTGREQRLAWDDVLVAASALVPAPPILLALHRPVQDAQLIRATAACSEVLLLAIGTARALRLPPLPAPRPALPPIALDQLAASRGWVVLHTPEQQIAAAALAPLGIRRRTGHTLALARDEDERAAIVELLARAGIGCSRTTPSGGGSSARSPHAFVAASRAVPRSLPRDAEIELHPGGTDRARSTRASRRRHAEPPRVSLAQLAPLDAGLAALGAMLRTPPWQPAPAAAGAERGTRRRRREAKQAHALLARWPAQLDDGHVGELLRCFGIPAAAGELVGSASAAGAAASELDGPALLRFLLTTQPTPRHELAREHLPTAAAVRQAYRDLAARQSPLPAAAHAWVTPQPPTELTLRCAVLPSGERPLLAAGRREADSALIARGVPIDAEEAERFAWQVLGDAEPFRGAALRVARLFAALGRLALATAGRLLWLHLDRVGLGSRPALLVIEGFGAQQR